MPEYNYLAADLLTNEPLSDLELYGVYFERNLTAAGQGTGTLKLGTHRFNDQELIDSTIPGRTALYAYRDGVLVWGGPIWQRTYQSQSHTLQLSCQTFESVFQAIRIEKSFSATRIDQIQILKQLIEQMQAQQNCNFEFNTDSLTDLESGVTRDLIITKYDELFFSDPINQLMEAEDSFDYEILCQDTYSSSNPMKIVRAGYPRLIPGNSARLTLDYPGNVDTYWMSESAATGAVSYVALGAGTGSSMIKAIGINGDYLINGWPNITQIEARTDVKKQSQIARIAQYKAKQLAPPVSVPVIQIKSDRIPKFEDWGMLGERFVTSIQDERFPNGVTVNSRMIGWQLTPTESDQTEILKFVLEGGDLANGTV